jgi:hypothetical protein
MAYRLIGYGLSRNRKQGSDALSLASPPSLVLLLTSTPTKLPGTCF